MLKTTVVVCVSTVMLSGGLWAKEVALPKVHPAVTLTLPDDWGTTEHDTEIVSLSPDRAVFFTIGIAPADETAALVKESKDFLRANKVNLTVKPTEQTMDINGVSGKLQRYRTTDGNGKTIADFMTMDGSDARAVLVTIWGSEGQRQTNDAGLSTIMASIKVPANGPGSSVWSGGTGPVVAGGLSAAKGPPMPAAGAVVATTTPLVVRRLQVVKRVPEHFGDIDAVPAGPLATGSKVITYFEPTGMAQAPAGTGYVRFGTTIDVDVRDAKNQQVLAKKGVVDREFVLATADLTDGQPGFYVDFSLDLAGFAPGAYVVNYIVRDRIDGRTTRAELPLNVAAAAAGVAPALAAPAPAPGPKTASAAPLTDPAKVAICASPQMTTQLMQSVNQAPDYQDGKRQLKSLVDPETLKADLDAHAIDCRYTAIWAEVGAGERRMPMTFAITDDGAGGMNVDYHFVN